MSKFNVSYGRRFFMSSFLGNKSHCWVRISGAVVQNYTDTTGWEHEAGRGANTMDVPMPPE